MYSLIAKYKFHVKRLRVTGGGVNGNSEPEPHVTDFQLMDFYVLSHGPDENTPDFAQNLWGEFV